MKKDKDSELSKLKPILVDFFPLQWIPIYKNQISILIKILKHLKTFYLNQMCIRNQMLEDFWEIDILKKEEGKYKV